MHHVDFELKFVEKGDFNQYWYSSRTIEAIRLEILSRDPRTIAFLSTPSLFFAVCNDVPGSHLFDLDEDFDESTSGRFIKLDYRSPNISSDHRHKYDIVVIDPPFISEEVIQAYLEIYGVLAKRPESLLLFTTISENRTIIERFMSPNIIITANFLPCIPNLVYQYRIFTNYEIHPESRLAQTNEELTSSE